MNTKGKIEIQSPCYQHFSPKDADSAFLQMFVSTYMSTQHHNPQDKHWHLHCCEMLKSKIKASALHGMLPQTELCVFNIYLDYMKGFCKHALQLIISDIGSICFHDE
jgi:hypothetical protein